MLFHVTIISGDSIETYYCINPPPFFIYFFFFPPLDRAYYTNMRKKYFFYAVFDYISQYSDWLWAGRSGDRIPLGARFSAPVQTHPVAHSSSCTMSTGVFLRGKEWPGRDADPSPPSSAVGHERVELYLYSPYGPYGLYRTSVPVQRVHFTFTLYNDINGLLVYNFK